MAQGYHAGVADCVSSIADSPRPRPDVATAGTALFPHVLMDSHDLERLVTLAMPFGKYKGRLMADLPGHYLNWFAREGFPPGEIGRLLTLMQELDHNGLRPLLDPLRKRLAPLRANAPRRAGTGESDSQS